jgi:hypothetical protein
MSINENVNVTTVSRKCHENVTTNRHRPLTFVSSLPHCQAIFVLELYDWADACKWWWWDWLGMRLCLYCVLFSVLKFIYCILSRWCAYCILYTLFRTVIICVQLLLFIHFCFQPDFPSYSFSLFRIRIRDSTLLILSLYVKDASFAADLFCFLFICLLLTFCLRILYSFFSHSVGCQCQEKTPNILALLAIFVKSFSLSVGAGHDRNIGTKPRDFIDDVLKWRRIAIQDWCYFINFKNWIWAALWFILNNNCNLILAFRSIILSSLHSCSFLSP